MSSGVKVKVDVLFSGTGPPISEPPRLVSTQEPSGEAHSPEEEAHTTNNNNNTFTWCGPSGVSNCTGQRPVGPKAGRYTSETLSYDGCHAVPFNLLTRV
jgi:hypothetical protein